MRKRKQKYIDFFHHTFLCNIVYTTFPEKEYEFSYLFYNEFYVQMF